MKRFVEMNDAAEETNYWVPVSNMLAGLLLVMLVIFAVGFIYYRNMPTANTQQASGTAKEVDRSYPEGLENKEKELDSQKAALEELAGIREKMAGELSKKLAGLNLDADIDQKTGSIRFGEAVLFDVNRTELNAKGQEYLKKLVPAYLSVVLSKEYQDYLDQIVVEGHADDGGTYLYNLELSQKRAYTVVNYIIGSGLSKLPDGAGAEKLLAISGRSFSKPVLVNGKVDRNLSRRVELVFKLKYDRLIDQMQEVFKGGEK